MVYTTIFQHGKDQHDLKSTILVMLSNKSKISGAIMISSI